MAHSRCLEPEVEADDKAGAVDGEPDAAAAVVEDDDDSDDDDDDKEDSSWEYDEALSTTTIIAYSLKSTSVISSGYRLSWGDSVARSKESELFLKRI